MWGVGQTIATVKRDEIGLLGHERGCDAVRVCKLLDPDNHEADCPISRIKVLYTCAGVDVGPILDAIMGLDLQYRANAH